MDTTIYEEHLLLPLEREADGSVRTVFMKFVLGRIWRTSNVVASVGCSVLVLPSTHRDTTGHMHRGMPYVLYRDGVTVFVPANAMESPIVFVAERLDGRYLTTQSVFSVVLRNENPAGDCEISASVHFQVAETAEEWTTKQFFLILKDGQEDNSESDFIDEDGDAHTGGRAGEGGEAEGNETASHVEASETVPTIRDD
ncbi:hypothetical protein C8Q76DRAFT_791482 [Earliella scabrosa]|nr:hypothetical protein C8Q76DRAFT_791482 [Earliella scabrosa]